MWQKIKKSVVHLLISGRKCVEGNTTPSVSHACVSAGCQGLSVSAIHLGVSDAMNASHWLIRPQVFRGGKSNEWQASSYKQKNFCQEKSEMTDLSADVSSTDNLSVSCFPCHLSLMLICFKAMFVWALVINFVPIWHKNANTLKYCHALCSSLKSVSDTGMLWTLYLFIYLF